MPETECRQTADPLLCNAERLELDLTTDNRVVITLRCETDYAAAVMFEEIKEAVSAHRGISLKFKTVKNETVIDRTRRAKGA